MGNDVYVKYKIQTLQDMFKHSTVEYNEETNEFLIFFEYGKYFNAKITNVFGDKCKPQIYMRHYDDQKWSRIFFVCDLDSIKKAYRDSFIEYYADESELFLDVRFIFANKKLEKRAHKLDEFLKSHYFFPNS